MKIVGAGLERARLEGFGRHFGGSEERSCSTSTSSSSGSVRRFLWVRDEKLSPFGVTGERERLDVEGSDRVLFM